jgi:prevent-host-death family protein
MATMSATDVKNRFGEALDTAQREPVTIHKNGRNVAVLLSMEAYQQAIARNDAGRVHPLVAQLHRESVKEWGKVFEALAK